MSPTVQALIAAAHEATTRAQQARAAAPKPKRIVLHMPEEQRAGLQVALAMEAQERAAWACALRVLCDEVGDQATAERIDVHLARMEGPNGVEWVQQPAMATQHLRDHIERLGA